MRSPNPAHVLKLASEIVAAQKQLDTLQAQWDALFSGSSPIPAERKPILGGTSSRVLEIINASPLEDFGVEKLHNLLGDTDRKPIESALFNLHKAGKIHRQSRGLYKSLVPAIQTEETVDLDDVFKF